MAKRKNKKIIVKRNRLKGNTATANRKYKDTVFRMLFSDRKNLLSLYNAINETSYTDAAQLEIVTLENAIYMTMANALSFIIDMRLALYEQQSTVNPRACLKKAFCKMCVTICGRFCPDEGAVAGYGNRIRAKYTAKWGVQIAGMIFQTRSRLA